VLYALISNLVVQLHEATPQSTSAGVLVANRPRWTVHSMP